MTCLTNSVQFHTKIRSIPRHGLLYQNRKVHTLISPLTSTPLSHSDLDGSRSGSDPSNRCKNNGWARAVIGGGSEWGAGSEIQRLGTRLPGQDNRVAQHGAELDPDGCILSIREFRTQGNIVPVSRFSFGTEGWCMGPVGEHIVTVWRGPASGTECIVTASRHDVAMTQCIVTVLNKGYHKGCY